MSEAPGQSGTDAGAKGVTGVVGVALFLAALPMPALYHSNQNTKFLQGMAQALPERLGADWTAQTVDGLPAFSFLIYAVAAWGSPALFYLLQAGLAAIMMLSLLAIARLAAPGQAGTLAFGLTLAGVFAVLIGKSQIDTLQGVAEQYMTNGFFQPSEFGILYLPALLLAVAQRRGAVGLAALPAVMHPAYILLSVLVCAAILWHARGPEDRGRPWGEAVVALVLIIVPVLDLALRFQPSSPELFAEANRILAFERIPEHSDPAEWLSVDAWRKLALTLLALWLAPPGVLRTTLALLLAVAALGTAIVGLFGSAEVALIAPWRVSILIVPLAVALVAGAAVGWLLRRYPRGWMRRGLPAVMLALAFLTAAQGLADKRGDWTAPPADHIAFVRATAGPGDVYLTPVEDYTFRLAALAPQYVTWKTHPYLDTEVLAWRERIERARAIYGGARSGRPRGFDCAGLEALLADGEVSHVLVRQDDPGRSAALACPALSLAHDGADALIFAATSATGAAATPPDGP